MIAWTDERRRIVLELGAGVEVVIPRSSWEVFAEAIELGQVHNRKRALAILRVDVPRELVEGDRTLRREAAAAVRRQGAAITAAVEEGKKRKKVRR